MGATSFLPRLRGRWSEGPEGGMTHLQSLQMCVLPLPPSVSFADSSPASGGAKGRLDFTQLFDGMKHA